MFHKAEWVQKLVSHHAAFQYCAAFYDCEFLMLIITIFIVIYIMMRVVVCKSVHARINKCITYK
jgi:hypothetical protein